MSYQNTSAEFQFESIFIIEAIDKDSLKRGTCFAVSNDSVLTAKHTLNNSNTFRCYLTSKDFKNNNFIELELIKHESCWDFAILKMVNHKVKKFIPISNADILRSTSVKSCGYPVESGHIVSPIEVVVNNHYPDDQTHLYNFELTQCKTIKDYHGMSGSPVLYKGHAIGLLVVQRGQTILKVISTKQIAKEVPNLFQQLNFQIIVQEEIEYIPPPHPSSPFYTRIDCEKDTPNIKGLEIGFDRSIWRAGNLIELSKEWIVDYALSASTKKATENMPHSQMRNAIEIFKECDMNTMCDLFLHIAIRQNHKTIPIVNKIFNTAIGSTLSCSHIVMEKGKIEIWLGVSSINDNLQDAINEAISNINAIFSVKDIENRLVIITQEMDPTWPFKERLLRITDSTIPLFKRFDRLVIPVFLTHDSDIIINYREDCFEESLQSELDECRLLLKQNFSNEIVELIDLKVFTFPTLNNSILFNKFKEGISL
ncbi:Hachiman antiphage defense system protein HamA [Shewanella glacialipiscicola]|uniref:Hachiman antiphage defense system protein HamA n=1 Tax=Shewanella glacialipiscicola TaxID=614069 RepID=UPI003D78D7F7